MVVQNVNSSSVYSTLANYSTNSSSTKNSATSNSFASALASASDTVTISQAAKDLAVSGTSVDSTSTDSSSYDWLSEAAHSNDSLAASIAKNYAYADELCTIDADTSEEMARNGTLYGYLTRVENSTQDERTAVREARIELYQSEKAKGTSDADIVDKLIAYQNALPDDYKQLTGWKG